MSIGEESQTGNIWEEEATVACFCTQWSIFYPHWYLHTLSTFTLEQRYRALGHWHSCVHIKQYMFSSSAQYTFKQGFLNSLQPKLYHGSSISYFVPTALLLLTWLSFRQTPFTDNFISDTVKISVIYVSSPLPWHSLVGISVTKYELWAMILVVVCKKMAPGSGTIRRCGFFGVDVMLLDEVSL